MVEADRIDRCPNCDTGNIVQTEDGFGGGFFSCSAECPYDGFMWDELTKANGGEDNGG